MVFETVQQIISEHFERNLNEIGPETSLADDLCADSLDVMDILVQLEDEFDINIDDEDAEELKTVGDLVRYIESRT